MLSDTTLCGVVKFLHGAKKHNLNGIVGLRIGEKTYIAKNTDELYRLFRLYSNGQLGSIGTEFDYIESSPAYFLPGQRDYFLALTDYLGKTPNFVEELKDINYTKLGFVRYELVNNQRLYRSKNDLLLQFLAEEKEHPERLRKEIEVIKKFGFEDYFHTVKKIVDVASKNDIEIGPGRGSVVGSLLAYRLGITKINPVEFGLLFERFLNEGRRDYPDIDIDVEDQQRGRLLELLRKEFGYVYNISAFSTIPEKYLKEFGKLSQYLSDIPVQRTTHAAGVIISTQEINVPRVPKTNTLEWDMKDLESLGYVKFDILGLKTLSVLKELMKEVFPQYSSNEMYKSVKNLEMTDEGKKVFKYISTGFSDNVFQLDSYIGKGVLRDIKPSTFNELALTISLNRPGPLKAGIVREIKQMKNKNKSKYNIDILSETFGIPIYQEQVMKIAMDLVGLTSSQADELRKAIAKKDISNIRETYKLLEKRLVEEYGSNGTEIARTILALGEYAFNKSHAVAYAHITFLMAYFKTNFPKLFYDVYLKYDTSVLQTAVYNLQSLGYTVLPPSVPIVPDSKANSEKKENIYTLPLYIVPGISYEKSLQILNYQFKNFEDFVESSGLSLSTIEALLKIGSFDNIFDSRRKAIQKLRTLRDGINPEVKKIGSKLFGKVIPKDETKTEAEWERTQMEYEVIGVSLTPPTTVKNLLAPYSLAYSLDLNFGIHIGVKAGFGTDGKSVFKSNMPDGEYTLIYPYTYEIGKKKVDYILEEEPLKSEISKSQNKENYERILFGGKSIPNARPIKNYFTTKFREE